MHTEKGVFYKTLKVCYTVYAVTKTTAYKKKQEVKKDAYT